MNQSGQGDLLHEFAKEGKQCLRPVPQVANTHPVNEPITEISFGSHLIFLLQILPSQLQEDMAFPQLTGIERCSIASSIRLSTSGSNL